MLKGKYITSKQFFNTVVTFTLIELCNSVACIIDGIITARFLGVNALAGVGLGELYFSVCAIISFTLAAGGQALCTYYIGKGEQEKSDQVLSSIIVLVVTLGGIITAVGIGVSGPLAMILGARGENAILFEYTKGYFQGVFIGTIPNIMIASISPLVTLDGKGQRVNVSSIVVLVADVIFDLLNALVLHWGTFGMGLATSLSYVLAMAVVMSAFFDKNSLFKLSFIKLKFSMVRDIVRTGYSRGIAMIARTFGPICINLYLLYLAGTVGLAAFSVQGSVKYLCISLPWGISGAVLLMGNNFFGEKDLDGIRSVVELALRYIMVVVLPLGVLLAIFSPQLAAIFMSPADDAFELTVSLLRIFFASTPIMAMNYAASSILQMAGRKKQTFLFNLANEFVGIVFFVIVMGQIGGIKGAWWAFFVWQVVLLLIYIVIGASQKSSLQTFHNKLLYLSDEFCRHNARNYTTHIESVEDASAESRNLHKFCVDNGVDEVKAMMVALCTEELSDNVVKHGFENGKKNVLEIRVVIDESKIIIHMRDNCKRFNFSEYILSHETNTDCPEKGFGIRMVRKMATDIQYNNTMNVNNLVVII